MLCRHPPQKTAALQVGPADMIERLPLLQQHAQQAMHCHAHGIRPLIARLRYWVGFSGAEIATEDPGHALMLILGNKIYCRLADYSTSV